MDRVPEGRDPIPLLIPPFGQTGDPYRGHQLARNRAGRIIGVAVAVLVAAATGAPAAIQHQDTGAQMSLGEKVGQLVMFSVGGPRLSATEKDLIRRHHLGGVILFANNYRNRDQLKTLTAQIQRAARSGNSQSIAALISVDQEGGVVKRFSDMPPRYSAPEMGERDPSVAYNQGRATGRPLRSAGVNVNLAPVADLDLPPKHVMRSRSFGRDPVRVWRRVRKFARGLQSRRVAATAKHFPGFGGATVNSDFGKAYVRRTKWQLHHVDAIPFHKAIEGGLRMVMVSHGMYVNDGGKRPASLNRYIATDRLRNEFGFTGVAISDDLNSVNWRFDGSTPRTCRATISAGVDIALITGDAGAARACAAAIKKAARSGAISRARIDRSVTRVLELKAWLGLLSP